MSDLWGLHTAAIDHDRLDDEPPQDRDDEVDCPSCRQISLLHEVTRNNGHCLYCGVYDTNLDLGRHYGNRTAADSTPPHSSSLPSVGHCGNNWWGEGGCGHLALAFANMYPDMKIGAEYDLRHGGVNHAWAYGEDGRSHDFMGTHDGHPYQMDRNSEIREDVAPEDLAADMGIDYNPDEDHQWDNPEIAQAGHLINRHWKGDTDYDGDDGYYDPAKANRTASTDGIRYARHIGIITMHPDDVEDYTALGNPIYPDRLPELKRSIEQNGIKNPLVIQTDGNQAVLADGHHRLMAAQELGLDRVPVVIDHNYHQFDDDDPSAEGAVRDYLHSQRLAAVVEADVAKDLRLAYINEHGEEATSGTDLTGIAENLMQQARHTGPKFHIPKAKVKDAEALGLVDQWGATDVRALQRQHSAEAEKYVNDILQSHGHPGNIRVVPDHWDTKAAGGLASTDGHSVIGLQGTDTNAMTLLHEAAHILAGTTEDEGHDPHFQRILHGLYREHISPSAANIFASVIGLPDEHTARLAMPMPMPEGITFHHHTTLDTIPDDSGYDEDNDEYWEYPKFYPPAVEARRNGEYVGHIAWEVGDPDHPDNGVVSDIHVDEPHRRQSIATGLFDFARQVDPRVHHSPHRTDLGRKWVQYEESRHRTAADEHPRDEWGNRAYPKDVLAHRLAMSYRSEEYYHTPLNPDHYDPESLPLAQRAQTLVGIEPKHFDMPTHEAHGYGYAYDYVDNHDPTHWSDFEGFNNHVADHGILRPLSIVTDGASAYLEDGHHRVEIARELNHPHVPVRIVRGDVPENYAKPIGEHLRSWLSRSHRTAMPAPLPEGITFHHHPTNDTIPTEAWAHDPSIQATLFSAPAVEARHNGRTVGYLEWDPPLHATVVNGIQYGDHPPEVSMIKVSPEYRRHGIATALFDFARSHQGDLEHSDSRTGLGNQWVDYEQGRAKTASPDGLVTIYHGTSDDNARAILDGQRFHSHAGAWFTTDPERAKAYGPAVIATDVPARRIPPWTSPRGNPEFYVPRQTRILTRGPFRRHP